MLASWSLLWSFYVASPLSPLFPFFHLEIFEDLVEDPIFHVASDFLLLAGLLSPRPWTYVLQGKGCMRKNHLLFDRLKTSKANIKYSLCIRDSFRKRLIFSEHSFFADEIGLGEHARQDHGQQSIGNFHKHREQFPCQIAGWCIWWGRWTQCSTLHPTFALFCHPHYIPPP